MKHDSASNTVAARPTLRILAGSDPLTPVLPAKGLVVETFPFVVGRAPVPGEQRRAVPNGLEIQETQPFRLSRVHFAIDRENGMFVIRDMKSRRGTKVNGRLLGARVGPPSAMLRPGENTVIVGGNTSPHLFRIIIEAN